MGVTNNKQTANRYNLLIDISLTVFILVMIFVVWPSFTKVIKPFVYAFFLAFLLNPIVNWLEHKGVHRILSIFIVFLIIVGLLTGMILAVVPKLTQDISSLVEDIPSLIGFIEQFIVDFRDGNLTFLPDFVFEYIDIDQELSGLNKLLSETFERIYQFLIASTGTLLDIVLTPIIAFYYLKDKDKIQKLFMKPISLRYQHSVRSFIGEIRRTLGGFLRGMLLVAAFVGVLTGLGCFIIGVPHALTIGLISGLTNIIPYFGPFLGGILPVILALMNRPITAIWVILLIVVVQQIESIFILPQVMSHSVGLHPLLIIFSVLFFGSLLGIAGLILGVPIAASIIVVARYAIKWRNRYRSPITIEE